MFFIHQLVARRQAFRIGASAGDFVRAPDKPKQVKLHKKTRLAANLGTASRVG